MDERLKKLLDSRPGQMEPKSRTDVERTDDVHQNFDEQDAAEEALKKSLQPEEQPANDKEAQLRRMLDMRNTDYDVAPGDETTFNEWEPRNMLGNALGIDALKMSVADRKKYMQELPMQMGMGSAGTINNIGKAAAQKILPKAVINPEFNRIREMIAAKMADKAAKLPDAVKNMIGSGTRSAETHAGDIKRVMDVADGPQARQLLEDASSSSVRQAEGELARRAQSADEATQSIDPARMEEILKQLKNK